jgi:hypothetical protein
VTTNGSASRSQALGSSPCACAISSASDAGATRSEWAVVAKRAHAVGRCGPALRPPAGPAARELTLKEIGDKYNLSRERIRQLQEQALGKIRKHMRA